MTFTSLPIRVIAPCLAALPTLYLAVQVYARLAATPASHVTTHPDAPASLRESATVRNLVNPQSRTITGDSRTIDIDVSGRASQAKDEVLLSAFARGFFGGSVFGLERLALKIARPGLLNFPEIDKSTVRSCVWDTKDLDGDSLPSKHDILFGEFQVADISLSQGDVGVERVSRPTESIIDFIYGSNTGQFAGVHRFGISRTPDKPNAARVSLESVMCNPSRDVSFGSTWMHKFHEVYAAMLFREAAGEVQRRIRLEEGPAKTKGL